MDTATRNPSGLGKFQVTDREECGLIIHTGNDALYVVRVPNRAENPDDYQIIKSDFDKVQNVLSPDESIVGIMHTHLAEHDCEPSDTDFEGAELHPEWMHLIYQPSTGKSQWYGADGGNN